MTSQSRESTAVPIDVSCTDDVMRKMSTNRRTLIIFPRPYGPHTQAHTTSPTLHAFAYTHTGGGGHAFWTPCFLCGSDDATAA
jgi:hypothetical protein